MDLRIGFTSKIIAIIAIVLCASFQKGNIFCYYILTFFALINIHFTAISSHLSCRFEMLAV